MLAESLRDGAIARGLGGRQGVHWPLERASKLFELRYGKALVASSRRDGDVPVFGTNGQTGTHDQALFEGPGVIIGRKGAGHLGVHWSQGDYWVIDTGYSLIPRGEIDLGFAYYLVGFVGLNHLKHGTSNPSLTREAFGTQYFPVPPIESQRSIAAALRTLDDKIESNRGATGMLQRLVALHFERAISDAEAELMPLAEIATITKGRSYKSLELQESETALVTLKSIDRQGGYKNDGLKPYVGEYKPEQVVRPGDLVVAQTDLTQGAEVVGRGVRIPHVKEYATLVASLDLAIVRPRSSMPLEYLHGLLTSESFRQHCRSRVTGTTVLHLAKDAMPTWPAPVLPPTSQEAFAQAATSLLARMDALNHESNVLHRLRDALLPELLSGRIRVPEAADLVQDVVDESESA